MSSLPISLLEDALDYNCQNPRLLEQALTHSSLAKESEKDVALGGELLRDNEKLEFLGDAVLSLVTSAELYRRFPDFSEGQLSKLRAHLVSQSHLVHVARRLNLGSYLRLGRGEERSGGRDKTALLVDALEAVLGALYLDGGLEPARTLVLREVVLPELDAMNISNTEDLPITDFKSALQEAAQAADRAHVIYSLVEQSGPDHSKAFTVEVCLRRATGDSSLSFRATGSTKKKAEQDAAQLALEYLFPKKSAAV